MFSNIPAPDPLPKTLSGKVRKKCEKSPEKVRKMCKGKKVGRGKCEKNANEGALVGNGVSGWLGGKYLRQSAGSLVKRAMPGPGLKNQPFLLRPLYSFYYIDLIKEDVELTVSGMAP